MPLASSVKIWTSRSISANGQVESNPIQLGAEAQHHAIYYNIGGSGVAKITILQSMLDGDDITRQTFNNVTGKGIKSLALWPISRLKIRVDEVSGQAMTLTLWFQQTGEKSGMEMW